jgi:8-oxo-dGTP pyrophosphatase MutT (NUDIX family)
MKTLPRLFYKLNCLLWRITRPTTVGVRLILVKDQAVLLVKHTYQSHWYLPGGGVKKGETIKAAAKREANEEFGAKLGDLRLFGVYTNFYEHKNDHVIVLVCEDFTLTGETDREIERFDFFRLDDLPAGVSPGSIQRIQEYVDGSKVPGIGMW